MGAPHSLSASREDPLTNLWGPWVEGPAGPLEILSLKPAGIRSSQCRPAKAGLGSAPGLQRNGPLVSVFRPLWNGNLVCSVVLWLLLLQNFLGVLYRYFMGCGFQS